jgi:hypothetical protein
MSHDEKLDLPSYEDSVSNNTFQDFRPHGQKIRDQLTTVRAKHVRSTVDTHIYPLIERRAERGLSQTVLALIPSNIMAVDPGGIPSGFTQGTVLGDESYQADTKQIPTEESSVTAMELLGLVHEDEDIEQIRLQGEMNHFEFWRQKDVVQDLQRVLQDRLITSPVFSFDAKDGDSEGLINAAPASPPQQKARGFFGRKSSKQAVQQAPPTAVAKSSSSSRIEAKVDLEEVCFRTVSSFGLYETITRPSIVVRVSVQC